LRKKYSQLSHRFLPFFTSSRITIQLPFAKCQHRYQYVTHLLYLLASSSPTLRASSSIKSITTPHFFQI
jgi:hypothetical protein